MTNYDDTKRNIKRILRFIKIYFGNMEIQAAQVKAFSKENVFQNLKNEIGKVIAGNEKIIDLALIALIANGHILFEGPPGVAKTTLVKAICDSLGLEFKRIQFTPDLLPGDLIGTMIYNQKSNDFEVKKGPVFANLILADEINRAPAKVQSALLEAMQESQVTIGSQTFILDKPFLVFATQNPLEQTGTYGLPEAQLDRFMFKIEMGYPSKEEEIEIIKKSGNKLNPATIINKENLIELQKSIAQIYIDEKILRYAVDIVSATRNPANYNIKSIETYIKFGASPRATLALEKGARARAIINGRDYVIPEDIKFIAPSILKHRIILSYEALAQGITGEFIINEIIGNITAP